MSAFSCVNQQRAILLLCVLALAAAALRLWLAGPREPLVYHPGNAAAEDSLLDRARGELLERGRPLDLNRAGEAELLRLEGIGPVLARRILAERARGGPFPGPAELGRRVRGVGPALLARLEGRIVFDAALTEETR